jgi:peptidoglycan/LPS O-acetylase OafA/YrhL
MSIQGEFAFILIWIVLLSLPIVTAIRRHWVAFAIFALGSLLFIFEIAKTKDGWDGLADIATLIVVVLPLYAVGLIAWGWSSYRRRKTK